MSCVICFILVSEWFWNRPPLELITVHSVPCVWHRKCSLVACGFQKEYIIVPLVFFKSRYCSTNTSFDVNKRKWITSATSAANESRAISVCTINLNSSRSNIERLESPCRIACNFLASQIIAFWPYTEKYWTKTTCKTNQAFYADFSRTDLVRQFPDSLRELWQGKRSLFSCLRFI